MIQDRFANEIPLTVTISTEKKSKGIVSVLDDASSLRALKISRDRLSDIPEDWNNGCGFYILVSETVRGKFYAYAGKATQNSFGTRLSVHHRERGNWSTAFLFRRERDNGLSSTQASYVEGALHRVFETCPWISTINARTAGDRTLLDHEVFYMNQLVKSALRILNVFGFAVEEDYRASSSGDHGATRYYGVSVLNLVRSGLLVSGEETVSLMESIPAKATIGDSGIVYQGKQGSPSGTAKEAKINAEAGKTIANGWTFWGVYRNSQWVSLDEVRAYYLAQKELYENSPLTDSCISFEDTLRFNEISRQVRSRAARPATHTDKDPSRHLNSRTKIYELMDAGLLEEDMVIISTDERYPFQATIANGGIAFNGNVYPDPRIAGKYAIRTHVPEAPAPDNGWEFWAVRQPDGQTVVFSQILDALA